MVRLITSQSTCYLLADFILAITAKFISLYLPAPHDSITSPLPAVIALLD